MKRLKLAAIAFAFAGLLASCGEDTIMEEIIEEAEIGSPSYDFGERPKTGKPS
ncbi:MAG: hypothetical protein AAGA85_22190 [Bacteroidota bacterium]